MPLGESKEKILEKYGPYVRSLAGQVRKQFSSQFEMEELMAWGQVGLLEAADRYNPSHGTNFLTFAHYRIKGAIFDGLRKMGVLKGNGAAAERANSYLTNKTATDSTLEDDVQRVSDAVTGLAVVFATSLEGTEGLQVSDDKLPADERLELEQMRRRVRQAIETLPEKERKLMQAYYFQNKTLEEAGAEIGQSKSWASRLHARAVDMLKAQLVAADDDNPSPTRRNDNGRTTGRNLGSTDRPAEAARAGRPAGPKGGPQQVRSGDEVEWG